MANLNLVDTKVTIAGSPCHFVHLKLNQVLNDHHTFTIKVDYEELDSLWMANPTKMIQMIGKDVGIAMQHRQTGDSNMFSGIITNVSMSGKNGEQNYIIVSGCSPTIKLDGTPTMDSFMDLTLKNIVQESIDNSGNGGEVSIKPVYKGKIDFLTQHNETCFQFLNRLSWLYGEFFFYDGTTCHFGKPDFGDASSITYDLEMTHFDLSANLIPPKVNRFEYLTHDVNEINADAPDTVAGVRGYIKAAKDASDKIYTSEATRPLETSILTRKELDDMVKVDKYRMISQMLVMRGTTQTCKVRIGKLLSVGLPSTMRVPLKHVETFLVTEVTHDIDQDGTYTNTFSAIPSEMENIPMKPVKEPIALPQIAWVRSNADEKGRVKVQFQWQKKLNKTTNWIRVSTPDGGSGEHVSVNRGFVFIPETGDQVMVNFENGNPNRPYVSGSIFTENISEGGYADNHLKSIKTRSGHAILFDDADGTLSITVKDRKGNFFNIDSANNNVTVTALNNMTFNATETMTFNCRNMNVNVGENQANSIGKNQQTTIGENQETVVGETISVISNDMEETYCNNTDTTVGEKQTINTGETDYFVVNGDMVVKSVGKALLQGAEDARVSKG